MTRAPLTLLAVLATACAAAPEVPQAPIFPPRTLPQHDHLLPSGLRVVVQEDHSLPVVTVAAIYGTGATSDPADGGGLAHLVEHLTYRAGGAELTRGARLKRAGATFNANTSADTTLYYNIAQKAALEELLQIEVERLTRPIDELTEADFEVERRVVVNELRQIVDARSVPRALSLVQERLFPRGHPLARPVNGTEQSMATLTRAKADHFVSQHYRPENCTLVIAGAVDGAQVAALMRGWPAELVASPEGGPRARRQRPAGGGEPPGPARPGPVEVKAPVSTPLLVLAWSLPGTSSITEATLLTLATAIEDAVSPLDAAATIVPAADASILVVARPLGPKANSTQVTSKLLGLLGDEAAASSARRATPDLRRRALLALLRKTADPLGNALELTRHLAATGRSSIKQDAVIEMAAVKSFTVEKLWRTYLRPDRAVSLVMEPRGDGPLVEAPAGVEVHELARQTGPDVGGMSPEDVLRVARPPGLERLPRFRLSNGLTVVALQRPSAALSRVDLRIPGGSAAGPSFAAMAASLSGTECPPQVPIEQVGGTLHESHGALASELSVVAFERNLANGLEALASEVRCRSLGQPHFLLYQALLRARRETIDTSEQKARRALWWGLYSNHPYGRMADDLARLVEPDRRAANAYLDAHFRPDDALAVATSARSPEALRALMEAHLAGWKPAPGRPEAVPPPAPPIPARRTLGLFAQEKRTQVWLQMGCRLPSSAELVPALDVLEKVVEQQADELREQWGATYGLRVSVDHLPGSAHLLISGAIDTREVGRALVRLLAVLAGDAGAGPDDATTSLARWEVARGFNARFATDGGIAAALRLAAQQGWPVSVWDRYPERLAAVRGRDLGALMTRCTDREVITLVGDVPALKATLDAAGLR